MTRLVVATWNVHGGVGTDGRFDLARTAAVIEALDADVIALQEVGDVHSPRPAADHVSELQGRTGLPMLYQPTMLRGERAYGNAIATRLPVERSRSYDLSVRAREPRGCLRADLRLGDTGVHVFGVHLGLSRAEQEAQAGRLLGADILRDAAVSWPLVVLGDFNFWWPGPLARSVSKALADAAVLVGQARRTFPARLPMFRLDRVLVDAAWDVLGAEVVRTPLARAASDHLPLRVSLALRTPAALPRGAEDGLSPDRASQLPHGAVSP